MTAVESMSATHCEKPLLIAVDGPSGAGKSSVCRRVARSLDAIYIDTGAMYRAATLVVLRAGIDPTDSDRVADVTRDLPVRFARGSVCGSSSNSSSEDPSSAVEAAASTAGSNHHNGAVSATDSVTKETQVFLGTEDVSEDIRSKAVTSDVSAVAANPAVREELVAQQQRIAREVCRAVLDGRDIGTVVLPHADLKVFLTASPEVRAQRRFDQDTAAGRPVNYDEVLNSIIHRDELDSSRTVSPLRPAEDAVVVDTSEMSINEVIDYIVSLARQVEAS